MQGITMLGAPCQPAMQQIRAMTSDDLLDRLRAWSEVPEPHKVVDLDSDTEFTYITPATYGDSLRVSPMTQGLTAGLHLQLVPAMPNKFQHAGLARIPEYL